jgi:hypothetical protein
LWNRLLDHAHSALAYCSYHQVETTTETDHENIAALREFGGDVIVWDAGPTSWRKAGYYMPEKAMLVLERKNLDPTSTPTISIRRGPQLLKRTSQPGTVHVPLQVGQRVLWLLGPSSGLLAQVRSMPGVECRASVCASRLQNQGHLQTGNYSLSWGIMNVW